MLKEFKVTLYTTQDCSKCKLLKMLLATKHVDFRELDAIANRDNIKDCWFASAPIIKFEYEWEPTMWFDDVQSFVAYLDDNWIGLPA